MKQTNDLSSQRHVTYGNTLEGHQWGQSLGYVLAQAVLKLG